jgi:hypothetical protein
MPWGKSGVRRLRTRQPLLQLWRDHPRADRRKGVSGRRHLSRLLSCLSVNLPSLVSPRRTRVQPSRTSRKG